MTSSDGSSVGTMDVKDYSLATIQAGSSVPIGNYNATVDLTADLSSVPSSIKLDIDPVDVGTIGLPGGPGGFSSLLAFDLARSSSSGEWPMKAGTVHMTLTLPLDALSSIDLNATFYLLKDDGTQFILYKAVPTITNGNANFDFPLFYEAASPATSGTFTLAGTRTKAAINTTATTTPAPVSPTPAPKSGSNASVLLLIAALGIAAISLSRGKKQ